MFLLIYYKRLGYGQGDAYLDLAPNPHRFLKHPSPSPHYNNRSGKIRLIRGRTERVLMGRMQIDIPNLGVSINLLLVFSYR